jgi:hypothetical protein
MKEISNGEMAWHGKEKQKRKRKSMAASAKMAMAKRKYESGWRNIEKAESKHARNIGSIKRERNESANVMAWRGIGIWQLINGQPAKAA